MTWLAEITALSTSILWLLAGTALLAGLIRGFAGFALSAVTVAIMARFLPPVELVPMLWFLEMAASLVLMKGGWKDADRKTTLGLFVGTTIGLPIGLALTLALPLDASKTLALILLITLAMMQLLRIRLPFLATTPGLYGSGIAAGVATGLAGVGGMFIAVYALTRQLPPRVMRGTLNIFLLAGGSTSLVTHLLIGTMDATASIRGLIFAVPCLIGVFLGQALFTPRYEGYYKPVCLTLIVGLALLGLVRLGMEG